MEAEKAVQGAVLAVFEDLGGYGAVARQQGEVADGPLVGHLQRINIQLTAIPVFARKGLNDTTVNDLLAAANVSRRTFYKYFDNKMDVLEGIYQTAVILLLARFRDMQQGAGSPQEWLRNMVGCFFDYHSAVGPIIRLMQEEALRADSPLARHRQRAHVEMTALLVERLKQSDEPRDPLTYRALIWALEATSLELLGRSATRVEIEHAKTVLSELLIASLCPVTT
ncbi:TetR/AcrR family transcriptional regulator [Pseudomonas sp. GV071]|jgi:AcrR family transcriptional regulator|uniref:TetR/AcrR family transcriptional regulator n=1 Tax=Pseudomonas sp. GV071 TaxID=2135754 RepID=UPI000D3ABE22|nr:TetR/AcrR family transcriptional regulator [Pseudomonas sp. GV071]PTQ71726.1 TetR family transcriptional regulator [Pseudomonas sp. GV071]